MSRITPPKVAVITPIATPMKALAPAPAFPPRHVLATYLLAPPPAQEHPMPSALPRLIGINHVALEVGDIEEALAFYGKIFRFTLRGRGQAQAFIDMGDQFLALMEEKTPHADRQRHFGLVVDDRAKVRSEERRVGKEWR